MNASPNRRSARTIARSNLVRWLAAVVIGSIAVNAWALLIYQPAAASMDAWISGIAFFLFPLVALGSPLAWVDLLLLRRLRIQRGFRRRLVMIGLALATGFLWFFLTLRASYMGVDPAVMGVAQTPWIIFGLIARVEDRLL